MKEVEILLDRRWVLKHQDPELYFKLRDQYSAYQEFFTEKLGYRIIVNPLLVKAEKLPGETHPWMGIQAFEAPQDYVFLTLILMFLEEKQPEEQFVLEQVTGFVQSHYPENGVVDWTLFSQRRALTRVLKFCVEEGLILVNDGDERAFEGQSTSAVLYENTGTSKYFMRHFAFELAQCRTYDDILGSEWQGTDFDRGVIRRHRVYRKMAMNPVVYQNGLEDQDYLYLKNQRSVMAFDFEKYLPVQLHLHRDGAMLMFAENAQLTDSFPNRQTLSDITLHLSMLLRSEIKWIKDDHNNDNIELPMQLSETGWINLVEKCVGLYSHGWSKSYREDFPLTKLVAELTAFMVNFGMLERLEATREIKILPAAFKFEGHYPPDYLKKRNQQVETGTNLGGAE